MAEPRGGSYFEFSSEKNWGIENDDCKIFDSIDITHLADSIASVPFHLRHNIPVELFSVEQLEEFEVEASLALSRHTFQCNSKLQNKTEVRTPVKCIHEPETDKLMKLILNNFSTSEDHYITPDDQYKSDGQLDAILGNMKPLINILQDETNKEKVDLSTIGSSKIISKIDENQISTIKTESESQATNDSSHWLDSMLDSDE